MSTFAGKIKEIQGISIDRFSDDNLSSEAFFLSHCHTDHMEGLNDSSFHTLLKETQKKIYLSHISAEILKNLYPTISANLVELEVHIPTFISLEKNSFTVTPIPAGHCPGSVMFLFEGGYTVLYTGDYRINRSDIGKFKAFYDSLGQKKQIDTVYLDTTFFLKGYEKFPARNESLEEICSIIRKWISKSDKHMIALNTCAKYGYEYLFLEIYKELKMPVHVNDEAYEFYSRVPELDKAVTRHKNVTRIHSACGSTYQVICMNYVSYKVKTIKVSAFRWKSENLQDGISHDNYYTHFVCYSTHASYEEGVELLKFLKPRKVEPNVLFKNSDTNAEIYRNIREYTEGSNGEPSVKKVKLFEIEDKKQGESICTINHFDSNILDSPPRG